MALFGSKKDDDWFDTDLSTKYSEDLFHCQDCDIEFSLSSDIIKDKQIYCPVCQKEIKAWQKNWGPN